MKRFVIVVFMRGMGGGSGLDVQPMSRFWIEQVDMTRIDREVPCCAYLVDRMYTR